MKKMLVILCLAFYASSAQANSLDLLLVDAKCQLTTSVSPFFFPGAQTVSRCRLTTDDSNAIMSCHIWEKNGASVGTTTYKGINKYSELGLPAVVFNSLQGNWTVRFVFTNEDQIEGIYQVVGWRIMSLKGRKVFASKTCVGSFSQAKGI